MVASRRVFVSVVVCIASLLLAVPARGQVTTATLYGVVQDTSRSVLPGVNVTVTHQGTTLTRETVTDARGEFALPALPAGPYAIKIELSGFKTYTSEGLKLGAGQEVRQSYQLEVGAAVRHRFSRQIRALMSDGHGHAGQNGLGRVLHDAVKGGGGHLRAGDR